MANGDFDEYGQVFQKIGEKFKWSGKRGPLEKGDFDEYGEFGENGEFGKNGDYGKKNHHWWCFDLQTNSVKEFFKEKYGDQSKEFVFGYWGLKD